MSDELFKQVKRKLNITWSDADTDANVEDIINSAIPTMLHKLGIADTSFDFAKAGAENTLFKNYCLYEYNHVANEFDDNYSNEIAQIRDKHTVEYYKSSEGETNA